MTASCWICGTPGARAVLEPGGLAVVVTPDIDRSSCRRYQIKPEEHVGYFNRRSLTAAMERAGFDVLICRSAPRYRDVVAAAASLPPLRALCAWLVKTMIRDEMVAIGRRADTAPAVPGKTAERRTAP